MLMNITNKREPMITAAEGIKVWTHALRVLEALTKHQRKKHFDVTKWGWVKKTECGTVACIAGWCAMDPWFRRRGLTGRFRRVHWFDSSNGISGVEWRWTRSEHTPNAIFGDPLYGQGLLYGESGLKPGRRFHTWGQAVKEIKAHIQKLEKLPQTGLPPSAS